MSLPIKELIRVKALLDTNTFLKYTKFYARRFKAQKGFGRWLVEYQEMEEAGYFIAVNLKEQFYKILEGKKDLPYIYREALFYIGALALDMTKAAIENPFFEIRLITGEIALNEDGEELRDLCLDRAQQLCEAMNTEAEELLFRVYNAKIKKFIL